MKNALAPSVMAIEMADKRQILKNVEVMNQANIGSDHRMVRWRVQVAVDVSNKRKRCCAWTPHLTRCSHLSRPFWSLNLQTARESFPLDLPLFHGFLVCRPWKDRSLEVMRGRHILLASIVLTFSGRCDMVFDGNKVGDIGHYCGNSYKCFSVKDFASCKCCSLQERINTISCYSSILFGWWFICIRKQRKDNGQENRVNEPNYISGTKITEVLQLISSNCDIQPLQAYSLVRYHLNDHPLQPYCTTWVSFVSA